MGWSYKHDFKIKFLFCCLSVFLFGSCSSYYLYKKIDDSNETKKIYVKNDGKVYLVNWNKSRDYINIDGITVSHKKNRREVCDSSNIVLSDINSLSTDEKVKANFEKDNLNNFAKFTSTNSSRSASNVMTVNTVNYNINDKKSFWVWKIVEKNNSYTYEYEQQEFDCKYNGDHCVVWYLPSSDFTITDTDCEKLGKKFDKIYEKEISLIGDHKYTSSYYTGIINSQNQIELVFFDINYDFEDGNILGYQSMNDVNLKSVYKNSNECQAIYLDSYYFSQDENDIYSTLVHEFNHLLNMCEKIIVQGHSLSTEEDVYNWTWYTEMLSMLTEDCFTEYLGINFFNSPKIRLYSYMKNYGYTVSPFKWFDSNSQYVTLSYASTYALGAYLARNFGGIDLVHEIATNKFVEEDSISNALYNLGYTDGILSKEEVFKEILYNEPYFLINTEARQNEDYKTLNKDFKNQYLTLNRKWISNDFTDLSLEAININDTIQYKEKYYSLSPVFLEVDENYSGGIYYNAYSIYYIDDNVKSFTVEVDDNYKGVYNIFYPTPLD